VQSVKLNTAISVHKQRWSALNACLSIIQQHKDAFDAQNIVCDVIPRDVLNVHEGILWSLENVLNVHRS